MTFFALPLVMLFYMWGGQTMKWIRPVGVALSISGVYFLTHGSHPWWWGFLAWIYGFELAFGYGDKSWIHKIAGGDDTKIRLFYGLWCSLAIIATSIVTAHYLSMISVALIFGAFQIHAGAAKFKIFGKYDFLWEDFWRSLAIGIAMAWALTI